MSISDAITTPPATDPSAPPTGSPAAGNTEGDGTTATTSGTGTAGASITAAQYQQYFVEVETGLQTVLSVANAAGFDKVTPDTKISDISSVTSWESLMSNPPSTPSAPVTAPVMPTAVTVSEPPTPEGFPSATVPATPTNNS